MSVNFTEILERGDASTLFDHERDDCLAFQQRWLRCSMAKLKRKRVGWDFSIEPGLTNVTYRDVKRKPLPNWRPYFERDMRLGGDL